MSHVKQVAARSERPTLSLETLHELSVPVTGPHVSIYLPLHRSLPEARQNERSYQSALQGAVRGLEAWGLASEEVEGSLRQLKSVPTAVRAWGHPVAALGVFQNQAGLRSLPLVFATPRRVAVGESFALLPLVRELHFNRSYHVLALSVNRVALFEGDAWGLHEVNRPGVPASLEDALGSQRVGRNLYQQRMTGGSGSTPLYQGQGGAGEERRLDRERYHRAVARALTEELKDRDKPLVLAADATHQGEFRQIAKLPQLLGEGLRGNADHLSASELHTSTWPIVQRHIDANESEAVAAYENACKVRKAADLLDDLGVAAVSGRVRRLWLGADRHVPGRVDPESGRILEAEQGDVDVFEALAVIVIRHRGEVRVIEPSGMPAELGAFAELR